MGEDYSYTNIRHYLEPDLYTFIHPRELEECKAKKACPSFAKATQDWNPGSLSGESEALAIASVTQAP